MADQPVNIDDRTITVPSIVSFYTDAQLNREYHAKVDYEQAIIKYGTIYKIVSFSEVSDPELLKQYCREWIRRNYYDGVLAFQVKAVDLHLLGYQTDKLMVGDRITVEFRDDSVSTPITRTFTCLSAQYDLLKPENSTFKIGIPDVSSNEKYRESVTKKSTSQTKPKSKSPIGLDQLLQEKVPPIIVELGLLPGEPLTPV